SSRNSCRRRRGPSRPRRRTSASPAPSSTSTKRRGRPGRSRGCRCGWTEEVDRPSRLAMPRPALTVIVTTFNEEANLRECLESLDFADEILLVDSFSTDDTVAIARSFPKVKLVQRQYFGSAAQKNWAMDQITTPWLLIVDADERVPEALAREIASTIGKPSAARAYGIRRRNFFLGREIRHSGWSTDRVVRLLEKDAARYPRRPVHSDLS